MRAYWQNVCNIILNPFKGSVGVVIILNLLVAVAAFVKDVLFAGYMGTTDYADSLTIAYFIPDTIGYGILATAIGYSCVPVFAKLAALDQEERLYICMRNSFYLFTCLTVMLFMGAFLFRGIIIRSFAGPEHMALTLRLYIIMLPIIILYPWVMIGSSILQAMNRFIAATAAPVIFNIVYLILLLAGIFFSVANETGVYVIAAGILVSVLFMVLLVWHSVGDSFHLAGILRPRGIISSLYKGK